MFLHSQGSQPLFLQTNGGMRPIPDCSRSTSRFAAVPRMAKKKFDDWKVIEKIKNALGANHSSLGQIVKTMVDSADMDLDQIQSASLKLNFLARSLKAGLADFYLRDTIGNKSH